MTDIRRLGSLLATDAAGNLVNPTSIAKVQARWRPLVEACVDVYRRRLGPRLHSVWLRGSAAKGEAIEGVADLDTFALHSGDSPPDMSWAEAEHERLVHDYPFCTGVELWSTAVEPLLEDPRRANLRILVKVLSTCAWGDDLRPVLPPVRPDAALVRACWTADRALADFERLLADATEDPEGLIAWALKDLLRCAQLLVVEREGSYGRDLYPCWESFARHYPEWRERGLQALTWCIDEPPADDRDAQDLVRRLGQFLVEEYARLYGTP